MSFCQNVRTALTRMAQKEAGRVRTEIREPQGPKDMQDESGRTVSATLCSLRRDVVRSGFAPGSARRGERLAKGQSVFARGRAPTRKKKPSEVLVSSFFPPSLKRPCGKTFSSLRQESFFMPQRNSIFAAKNARRGGEMLHTDSSPARFLTARTLFATSRPATGMRDSTESLAL